MSYARKCDRCGAYYDVDTKSRVIHEYYPNTSRKTANGGDVCPRCAERFAKWWNRKRKEDK